MSAKEAIRIATRLKQRFTSDILWHFVGRGKNSDESYKVLLSILESGLKLGAKAEEFKYINHEKRSPESAWGFPVSCLADIPLKDLHIHAERYGKYAIGFHKESAIKHGFNPVLYVNQNGVMFPEFMKLRDEIELFLERKDSDYAKKFDRMMFFLGSVAKSGNLLVDPLASADWDHLQINNFYYEREWRSVHEWTFTQKAVALIIIPEAKLEDFFRDRETKKLKVDIKTPIIPFEMICSL